MIRAVLFDRDGTLVADIPGAREFTPMPRVGEALRRLRENGIRIGVVTNQSAVCEGRISADELARIHRHIEEQIGPIDGWFICPHAVHARCGCRKPQPGLVLDASRAFGIRPEECVVIGDIGSDVDAALAAGARAVLVPTPVTLPDEVRRAPVVSKTLWQAVELVLAEAV
jgi:D-glycero-D-manno-heptose 1,7-bisphosphate phosphatase